MRDLNSQLHNEVQVGRALEDILQGDDIGVLDSEEDRPKPSHSWQTSSAALPPGGAICCTFPTESSQLSLLTENQGQNSIFALTEPTVRTSERT